MLANTKPSAPIYVASCCLLIILALVLGVGLASHSVLRHIVQTAPLWVAVVLGFRRSHAALWMALPFFLFWLLLMALIWAYLLGISTLFNGQFSPVEIAMTFIVGAASVVGIICFVAFETDLSWVARIGLFVMMAVIQWGCFRLSFLPAIAHRGVAGSDRIAANKPNLILAGMFSNQAIGCLAAFRCPIIWSADGGKVEVDRHAPEG